MFSLLWSEHCAYKHSRKLLGRLPTEGPRVVMGPGENAGRGRRRRRLRGRLQGRVAQPPLGGRAVPGRRDGRRRHPARRLRARRPADRDPRLASLRRALLGALALPLRPRRRRHRPLRQLDRRPDGRRRGLLRASLRAELPRERDVHRLREDRLDGPRRRGRRRQPGRADGRVHGPRRDRRRLRPRLGGARRGRRVEAPLGPDRRPVRGVEARRVLPGAARRGPPRVAPGPGRGGPHLVSRRDGVGRQASASTSMSGGAAPRGRHGAVRDHGLRIAGADARRGRAGEGGRGAGDLPQVAGRARRGRRGNGLGPLPRPSRRRGDRRDARRGARRRLPALRPRARGAERLDLRQRAHARDRRPRARRCSRSSPRPRSHRRSGPSSSTTRSSARAPSAAPRRPTPRSSSFPRPATRSRPRSTATAGAWPATRTAARSRRCSSALRTWRASAPSRSASPTASTSATPRSPPSPGSSTARYRGSPTRARRWACRSSAATSRSTTRRTRGPIYPTPVVGLVGELPDARKAGGLALSDGDAIALVGPFDAVAGRVRARRSFAASSSRACRRSTSTRRSARSASSARRRERATSRSTTSPTAASPARSPRWRSPGGIGARCDLDALIRTRGSDPEAALFGEGPGGYLVAGAEERVRELQARAKDAGVDAWVIGSAGGDRIEISSEWMEPSVAVRRAPRRPGAHFARPLRRAGLAADV